VIDRETGDVLGLVWTGRTPEAGASATLELPRRDAPHQHPEIWSELTLAVPAAKIRERIEGDLLTRADLGEDERLTLAALVAR